jgi:hypothetical protein
MPGFAVEWGSGTWVKFDAKQKEQILLVLKKELKDKSLGTIVHPAQCEWIRIHGEKAYRCVQLSTFSCPSQSSKWTRKKCTPYTHKLTGTSFFLKNYLFNVYMEEDIHSEMKRFNIDPKPGYNALINSIRTLHVKKR